MAPAMAALSASAYAMRRTAVGVRNRSGGLHAIRSTRANPRAGGPWASRWIPRRPSCPQTYGTPRGLETAPGRSRRLVGERGRHMAAFAFRATVFPRKGRRWPTAPPDLQRSRITLDVYIGNLPEPGLLTELRLPIGRHAAYGGAVVPTRV